MKLITFFSPSQKLLKIEKKFFSSRVRLYYIETKSKSIELKRVLIELREFCVS